MTYVSEVSRELIMQAVGKAREERATATQDDVREQDRAEIWLASLQGLRDERRERLRHVWV